MSHQRQAALLVHALGSEDSRWVLSRLPSNEREIVAHYLAELKKLNIPAEPGILQPLLGSSSTMTHDLIDRASAADMHRILEHEPIWLVRQILALRQWQWAPAFLALQSPLRRERLGPPSSTIAGTKLADALGKALAERLSVEPTAIGTSSGGSNAYRLALFRNPMRR